MAIQKTRRCSLAAATGRSETCPEDVCPFWESGGAALEGRCAFDRIGLPENADLASWLLEIRRRLEAASSIEEERALRGVFHQLLNGSSE